MRGYSDLSTRGGRMGALWEPSPLAEQEGDGSGD